MDTYIPSTPDYVRSLVNVVYDFNLPLLAETLGTGSGVRVVPVEGDAGKEVVACIVREALENDYSALLRNGTPRSHLLFVRVFVVAFF